MRTVRYAAWVKLIDEQDFEVNEPAAHLTLRAAQQIKARWDKYESLPETEIVKCYAGGYGVCIKGSDTSQQDSKNQTNNPRDQDNTIKEIEIKIAELASWLKQGAKIK